MEIEICIIDDSADMRFITSRVCKKVLPDVPIQVFEGVDDAIEYITLNRGKRRVVFVDLDMPQKNGWDFLDSFVPKPDDIVFILSSSGNEEYKQRATEYSIVSDYLEKPLTLDRARSITAMI